MALNDSLGIDIDVEDVKEKVKDAVLDEGAYQVGAEDLANLFGFTDEWVKMKKLTTEAKDVINELKAKTKSCDWTLESYTKIIPLFCGEKVMVILAWPKEKGEYYYVSFVGRIEAQGGQPAACEWSGVAGQHDLECGCDGLSLTELMDEYVKQFLSDDYEANMDQVKSWTDSGSGCSYGDTSSYSSSYEKQDPEKIADTIIDDIVENRYEGVLAEVPSTSARAVTVKQALDTLYALINEEEEE